MDTVPDAHDQKNTHDPTAIQTDATNNATTSARLPTHQQVTEAEKEDFVETTSPPLTPTRQSNRGRKRFFGLPRRHAAGFPNPDDYELKYPADQYGDEAGPAARVWRTYLDEAQKADAELIEGWRDTTDVLLVFAGLFSAVVATFVVQTSTNLQPDYTQITASLLFEQNSLLRAMANHSWLDIVSPSPLTPTSDFPISANDRWINGLWFTSLSVSLVAAFMTVLIKQWMQHYQSVVFGTPIEQVRIRQFRFLGVERWHMPLIIGTLPMLLHLGALLYFAGLILFLIPLDAPTAYTTIAVTAFAYTFYVISNLLPLQYPMCPYKTPLSSLVAALISSMRSLYPVFAQWSRTLLHGAPSPGEEKSKQTQDLSTGHRALHHMKDAEKAAAFDDNVVDQLDAESLVWLYFTSSNPTIASVTVQAISGLRLGFSRQARGILETAITFREGSVEDMLLRSLGRNNPIDEDKMERFLRACHQLEVKLTHPLWLETRDAIQNSRTPTLEILHASHALLHQYHFILDIELRGGAPVTYLESYDYSDEKTTPFMWSSLLRRCSIITFASPIDRWLHGLRVLHGFGEGSSSLRRSMLLEYFCSLSVPGSGTDWGEGSVLKGSPFRVEKVLPQVYIALSEAIRAVHTRDPPELGLGGGGFQLQTSLPQVLDQNLNFLARALKSYMGHVDSADRTKIANAAAALRFEMQNLVESDIYAENQGPPGLGLLCEIMFFKHYYWPPWMSRWIIPWTPRLVDYFLQCDYPHNLWAIWSFYEGDPDLYRLFDERNGLSKLLDRKRYGTWLRNGFLAGLIRWKGDVDERERHIDNLFSPGIFPHIAKEAILRNDQGEFGDIWFSTDYIRQLFILRPPDRYPDLYQEYMSAFRELLDTDRDPLEQQALTIGPAESNQNILIGRRIIAGCRELLIRARGGTGNHREVETGIV